MSDAFIPDPSWPSIEELARECWGKVNVKLSTKDEIKFGLHGSKSINPKSNLWHDHESGKGGGYLDLYQIVKGELPPPRTNGNGQHKPIWEIAATYDYTDADGNLLIQVVRTTDKQFRQRKPLSKGKWSWSVQDVPGHDSLLYRLPSILVATDQTIWICEGEKDADRLHGEGLIATTNIGGAGKWRHDNAEVFRSRHVVVLPDNDRPGRDHAAQVAKSLKGIAASVRILELPNLPNKGDVSDWLDSHGTVDDLQKLADRIPYQIGRIRTGSDFIASFIPPDWLIDGIVQRSRLYACTSLTGHGKTAVWLFNACMIQTGRMVGNLETQQGNVLYLAGENPEDLKARMIGMADAYNIPRHNLPYVLPGNFPMTDEETVALKREMIGLGVPLVAIIGDTASSFFPGDDENNNVQAGGYARTCRTFTDCPGNPAVVLLCHPVKNAAHGNLLPRGGGAFLNELDGNLTLWSTSQGEVTELHWCGKIRGPDFSPVGFKLRSVPTGYLDRRERPVMTIVAEPMSEEGVADYSKQTLANEDVVLIALRDHPEWSYAQIAREAGWLDAADQPMRTRVQKAVRSLADDKLIFQPRKGDKWRLTEKGEAEYKECHQKSAA